MEDIPKTLSYLFFGCVLLLFIFKMGISTYKQDSIVNLMQQNLKVSALESKDDTARLKKGQFKLDVPEFERKFEKRMVDDKDFKTQSQPSFNYEYLGDGNGGIKAIKIKANIDGRVYQATNVLSNGKDM